MIVRVLDGASIAGSTRRLDRKARELLTTLALHAPTALSVDELVSVLWDDPPPSAAKTVIAHLSRLRRALEDSGGGCGVERRGGHYRLVVTAATCDVLAIRQACLTADNLLEDGRPDRAGEVLSAALALCPGQPELPDTVGALALRQAWNEERRRLITQRLRAIVDGGQPDGAIGPLRQLTAGEPLAEPFWVLLVTALQRSGRQSEALRAAQEARAALAAVGLEPGAALRAAEAEALRNDERSRPDRGAASAEERRDDVRYAGGPGRQVAYTTFGDGDADIVVLNPAMLSIDALFDERRLAHGIRRLASTGRVAFFDRRGIGLSDPLEAGGDALDAWVDDLAAVLDALGARRSVLVANFDTGLIALEFAARHGERLAKLVLVHCFARFTRTDDYPYGLDPATASNLVDASTSTTAAGWNPLHLAAPSVADDPAFRAWWDRTGRRAASPATAAAILTTEAAADVRHRLSAITVRTLVLHRQACVGVDLGHAHYLAQHLPAAELRIVGPGHDSLWFTDHPALLDELVDYCGA